MLFYSKNKFIFLIIVAVIFILFSFLGTAISFVYEEISVKYIPIYIAMFIGGLYIFSELFDV